jgi:hypothetical protein
MPGQEENIVRIASVVGMPGDGGSSVRGTSRSSWLHLLALARADRRPVGLRSHRPLGVEVLSRSGDSPITEVVVVLYST